MLYNSQPSLITDALLPRPGQVNMVNNVEGLYQNQQVAAANEAVTAMQHQVGVEAMGLV